MKREIIAILLCLAAPVCLVAQNYINPMDHPVMLSASFAELRPNHFHGGLDISTGGRVGVPVKSVADGYVSRIKVSPYGYGHGLYVAHYDGHTTVYGHLSEYAPKIDSVIRKEQYMAESFEVDYYPEPGALPVECGEVIAYSGNTGGSGGPHLHFEVRDTKSDDPLNPLAFLKSKVADHRPPKVSGIKVYAMDDMSCAIEKYYDLRDIEGKAIEALGLVGFGIDAVDYFDEGGRPCGVVSVSLYDNDRLVFQSVLERVPFDKTRYINSMVDYAELQRTKRYVQKSFVDANNRLDIYRADKPIFVKHGETHRIRYELRDFSGNTTVVKFDVIGRKPLDFKRMKHAGELLEWRHDNSLDSYGAVVDIPAGAFYKDEFVEFGREDSSAFRVPLFTVGSAEIPVHKAVTIAIPVADEYKTMIEADELDSQQVFVARVGRRNALAYLGGRIDGGVVTAESKSLGKFMVAIDTVPPRVFRKNQSNIVPRSGSIMIGVADNLSGISKYNCYIDGKWELFEFDYKNARLIASARKLGLAPGAHSLVAKVEDPCGNVGEWRWEFRVR